MIVFNKGNVVPSIVNACGNTWFAALVEGTPPESADLLGWDPRDINQLLENSCGLIKTTLSVTSGYLDFNTASRIIPNQNLGQEESMPSLNGAALYRVGLKNVVSSAAYSMFDMLNVIGITGVLPVDASAGEVTFEFDLFNTCTIDAVTLGLSTNAAYTLEAFDGTDWNVLIAGNSSLNKAATAQVVNATKLRITFDLGSAFDITSIKIYSLTNGTPVNITPTFVVMFPQNTVGQPYLTNLITDQPFFVAGASGPDSASGDIRTNKSVYAPQEYPGLMLCKINVATLEVA